MCLFYLIKKNNRVWFSSDGFGKLTALFISYVSWRRSNQTRYGIFLHILTHINTNHVLFVIKQACGKCFRKFCLTYTSRSEEHKGTDWLCRIFNSCFRTDNGFSNLFHTFILTDNSFMEFLIKIQCLISLTLGKFCYRNTRPAADDRCDFIIGYRFVNHRRFSLLCTFFRFL